MRNLLTIILTLLLFACTFTSMSQDENVSNNKDKKAVEDVLNERQNFYTKFDEAKLNYDSTHKTSEGFIATMYEVIKLDDVIVDQYLLEEYDRANDLDGKLQKTRSEVFELKKKTEESGLYFLIAAGSAGLMFLLFIIVLIVNIIKSRKLKKLKKLIVANEETVTGAKQKVLDLQKEIDDLNNSIIDLKSTYEKERKSFAQQEAQFNDKVRSIEDKIKKSNQKETDMNYQIFQLEMRLKNEVETVLSEKCELENTIAVLNAKLEQTANNNGNDNFRDEERNNLQSRISELEREIGEVRQWAENEKTAKENAEEALRNQSGENHNIYQDQENMRTRIAQLENQINEFNNKIGELNWYLGEEKQRASELENQLNELRPKAEEAENLRTRLNELLQFVDKLRN